MYTPCGGVIFSSPLGEQVSSITPLGHNQSRLFNPTKNANFYPLDIIISIAHSIKDNLHSCCTRKSHAHVALKKSVCLPVTDYIVVPSCCSCILSSSFLFSLCSTGSFACLLAHELTRFRHKLSSDCDQSTLCKPHDRMGIQPVP